MKTMILLNGCINVANSSPLERKTQIKIDVANKTVQNTLLLFSSGFEQQRLFLNQKNLGHKQYYISIWI